ncbi:MAG TPA: hypothetical protein VGB54_03780 [Allosphingosinicella sp.]
MRMTVLPLLAVLAASTACTARNEGANSANSAKALVANGADASAGNAATANKANPNELPEEMRARAGLNGQELRLTGNGLATASPGLHSSGQLAFGQAREEVLAAVTATRGRPTASGRNAECPSGPVEFAEFGPLALHFENGRFAGWVLEAAATPPIEEEYGLAIGTTRADLQESDQGPATFENGSLGPEFDFNGIGGLLDGPGSQAKVKTLFAGVTCFAR